MLLEQVQVQVHWKKIGSICSDRALGAVSSLRRKGKEEEGGTDRMSKWKTQLRT